MIDQLFVEDAPDWLNHMYETLIKDITMRLRKDSLTYQTLITKMNKLYDENPQFVPIMENEQEQKELTLTALEVKKLAELINAELEAAEMYKRMLYVRGLRDGILFAQNIELL